MKESTSVRLAKDRLHKFGENFKAPDEDALFELFTAHCVLKKYGYDSSSLYGGLVGGARDGGIDWVYVVVNGTVANDLKEININYLNKNSEIELIIGQAKNSSKITASVGEKFMMTFSALFCDNEAQEHFDGLKEDLKDNVREFLNFWAEASSKRPKLTISVYYCHLSNNMSPENAFATLVASKEPLMRAFPSAKVNVKEFNAQKLYEAYDAHPSYDASLVYQEELDASTGKVALVKLKDYYDFLTDDEENLNSHYFEANVRDFQGNVKVNKEIKESLCDLKSKVDFWWKNNGITILVSESPSSQSKEGRKTYSLADVQIVNGLQTSYSIYEHFHNSSHLDEKVTTENQHVLVRILSASEDDEKDQIIRATNSQTKIDDAVLRATDRVHRTIESLLEIDSIFYDRRKNYYKNQGKRPDEIISIKELGQSYLAVFLMKPNTARARPSQYLGNDKLYSKIFSEEISPEKYVWCATMFKRLEKMYIGYDSYSKNIKTNIFYYVLLICRIFGCYHLTQKNEWNIEKCPSKWYPNESQLVAIADWVAKELIEFAEEQNNTYDGIGKGQDFKEHLQKRWIEDAGIARAIKGSVE